MDKQSALESLKVDSQLSPRVKVYNEWDPLEEIIVGTAKSACIPDGDAIHNVIRTRRGKRPLEPAGLYPKWLIDETEEDLENLVALLKQADVTVRRAESLEAMRKIRTPDWETTNYFPYCPRDVLLAVGDTMIETPGFMRSRYFETFAYRHLVSEYLDSGARWISAPHPRLDDTCFNPHTERGELLNEVEPIFDAANVLRIGRDVLYLVSDSGNAMGAKWLQSTLGADYRVHTLPLGIQKTIHVDTTITPLRPGLVLMNPARVPTNCIPKVFDGWDVIFAPEMVEYSYSDFDAYASTWLGMNLLMISPDVAFVDVHQKPLIRLLSKHGIECVPVLLRHGRTLGGGVHCVTLDVRRCGELQDYRG